jgi:hypothetical protein
MSHPFKPVSGAAIRGSGGRPQETIVGARLVNGALRPTPVTPDVECPRAGVGKVDKKLLKASFWVGRKRMVG